jgi:hypothetical protein
MESFRQAFLAASVHCRPSQPSGAIPSGPPAEGVVRVTGRPQWQGEEQ